MADHIDKGVSGVTRGKALATHKEIWYSKQCRGMQENQGGCTTGATRKTAHLGVLDERLGVQVGGLLSVENSAHFSCTGTAGSGTHH